MPERDLVHFGALSAGDAGRDDSITVKVEAIEASTARKSG
jgi:hypothetical protein